MLGIILKQDEAISVLKELLDGSVGLDGHGIELSPPKGSTSGYQIVIRGKLGKETKQHIQETLIKQQLAYQEGNIWRTKHSPNKIAPRHIHNLQAQSKHVRCRQTFADGKALNLILHFFTFLPIGKPTSLCWLKQSILDMTVLQIG